MEQSKRLEILKSSLQSPRLNSVFFISTILDNFLLAEIRHVFESIVIEDLQSIEMIQLFLEKFDALNESNFNSILISMRIENLDVIRFFVDKQLKQQEQQHIHDQFALCFKFASTLGNLEILEFFHSKCLNLQNDQSFILEALQSATERGQTHILKSFFVEKYGVEKMLRNRTSSLILASIRYKHFETLKYLFENNARYDDVDEYRLSCFATAANVGNLKILNFLFEQGKIDVNAIPLSQTTTTTTTTTIAYKKIYPLLCFGCTSFKLDVIRFLVEKAGANVNIVNPENGKTPLHIACAAGNLALVKYLVEHGSKLDCVDFGNATPLKLSISNGNVEVVKFLVEKGAFVDEEVSGGNGGGKGEKKRLEIEKILNEKRKK